MRSDEALRFLDVVAVPLVTIGVGAGEAVPAGELAMVGGEAESFILS